MKNYKTKYWAGMNKDQCWCGKKAVGKFKSHLYCNKHLEEEQDNDERRFSGKDTIEEQAQADYIAAAMPRTGR
jgi:hypothetical protein